MAVCEYAWQTCRSAHTDPSTSCWNLFTDSADQSIMSSLSLAHTLFGATYLCRCPHNTQNVVNPTWIVRAEGKKKRKHISYCLCIRNTHTHTNTNTQKIRHKERNSIEDWSQIAREKLLSQQAKNKYPKFFSLREWYAASPAHSATAVSSFARVNSPFVCLVVLLVYCFY